MSNLSPRDASTQPADSDRIQVAQLLTDAAAEGRLEPADYQQRLAGAYSAKSFKELRRLTRDLPLAETTHLGDGPRSPAPSTLLLAIMSGFERRGRWPVPGRLTTFTLFGGGVIDLRYADFTSADIEIHAYSIMGGQTILLPPEVNVEVHGKGVMGGFEHHVDGEGTPGAPKVTVRGFSFWGGVGIKRKNRQAHKSKDV
jgi:hypothetical protein